VWGIEDFGGAMKEKAEKYVKKLLTFVSGICKIVYDRNK
tara:strand:- start:392 stop:508 length:117 start_codon:yes stop_codon:yes gene_type:complete